MQLPIDRPVPTVDPYNQRIPESYWQNLGGQKPPAPPDPPQRGPGRRPHFDPGWLACAGIAALLLIALCSSLPKPVEVQKEAFKVQATPEPALAPPGFKPVEVPPPHAQPVEGPLTSDGKPMLSGQAYYVDMPDGRNIRINYRGWVDHACNLPRQHGINNAAYTDRATGNTWIWTIPAAGSNIPRWIDP